MLKLWHIKLRYQLSALNPELYAHDLLKEHPKSHRCAQVCG